LQLPAKSREIQDYYSAVTMKSSGDISAEFVRQGLQTTARGPNPAREAVSSCPPGSDEGGATAAIAPGPPLQGGPS